MQHTDHDPEEGTMNHDNLDRPYAVYGTLRSGESNARLWQGLATGGDLDLLSGYRLVSNGYFPYALPAANETTVVEIVRPVANQAAQYELRERLDNLEGYPTLYDRLVVTTDFGDQCWLYMPVSDHERLGRLPRVLDNDWTAHCDQFATV